MKYDSEYRIAHLQPSNFVISDLSTGNIMFDGSAMYPSGFHPVRTTNDETGLYRVRHNSRRSVKYVRYYFIDFGLSTLFEDGESHLVTGSVAQDPDIPELSDDIPYDAFAMDIFTLGNVFGKELVQVGNL